MFDNISLKKKRALFLSCFDHNIRLKSPLYFYYEHFKLKESHELSKMINYVFTKSQIKNTSELYYQSINQDLSRIIYELIDNTHKHARHKHGNPSQNFSCNMRAAYLKLSLKKDFDISDCEESIGVFTNSLSETELMKRSFMQTHIANTMDLSIGICELSVIDSGIGLVQKASGKFIEDISISDEIVWATNCFKKHFTSDNSDHIQKLGTN